MSLISMFTIGIPGFFLALQPNGDIIHGRFLSNVLIKALPAGLTDFLVVGALVVFGSVFGVNETDISTACTMVCLGRMYCWASGLQHMAGRCIRY